MTAPGADAPAGASIHATCVVVGEAGILIRGPSGAGKSTLARTLVDLAAAAGRFSALVGDDRVVIDGRGGRLVARPHPALVGRVEIRGWGIVGVPYEPAAVVRLVVDCGVERPPRLPAEPDRTTVLRGVRLPRLAVEAVLPDTARTAMWILRGSDDTCMTVPAR